jgi:hypothetical protein
VARRPLLVLLVAAALGGCGDDETTSAPSPTPEATAVATEEPTPSPTATETPSPTATEQPAPEEQEGGAGDEEAARVPAAFTVDSAGVHPPQVAVPAFLAIELSVQNGFASPITVRLEGAEPFRVGPYATEVVRLEGRRPGRHVIDFGRGQQGLLVTGAEPGP